MKKKIFGFLFLSIIALITFGEVNEVQAICSNCEELHHSSCTNLEWSSVSTTKHIATCCCGASNVKSGTHTMVRVGQGGVCYKCSVCNYTTSHTYGNYVAYSSTQHQKVCSTCGIYAFRADHYDNNTDGKCDACGYAMTVTVAKPTATTTSFVYDGSEKSIVFSGFDSSTMTLSGDSTATDAGSYTAIVSLQNTSTHKWSDGSTESLSFTWEITKADGYISLSAETVTAPYGSSIKTFTVTSHHGGTLTATQTDAEGVAVSVSGTTVTISSFSSLDVGTMITIRVTSAATTNYKEAYAECMLGIYKASITPTVNMTGYTYGGTKSTPSVTGNKGNGTVTYYYNTTNSNINGTLWSTVTNSTNLNAGTYYMYAVVSATTNYNGATTDTVSFTVSKASGYVDLNSTTGTAPYGTSLRSFSVTSHHGGTLSVSQTTNTGATVNISETTIIIGSLSNLTVGTKVTIRVTSAATTNYNEAYKDYTLTISRASITPTVNMTGYMYGGTKSTPSVTGNTGNGAVTYYYNTTNSNSNGTLWSTVTSSTSLNAGTYYMYAVISETANYSGATTLAKAFTISKATGYVNLSSTTGTVPYGTASKTFAVSSYHGGTLSVVEITSTAATVNINGKTVTISTLGALSSGTEVTVRVTSAATINYNSAYKDYKLTITKANVTPKVNMSGYTYGGTKSTPSVTGNIGNGAVTYYYNTADSNSGGTAWSTVTSSTSLDAGTYYMYAVIAATTNYNEATTSAKSFTISKASGYVDLSSTTGTVPYGTNLKGFSVTSHHGGTLSVSQTTNTGATVNISETTIIIGSLSNLTVGTKVIIRVTSAATTNYNEAYKDYTLTVIASGSADFSITLDEDTYTYDGTAKTPNVTVKVGNKTLTNGTDYNVKYSNNIDAGSATVLITGIGNYQGSSENKEFTIAKRNIEITAGSKSKPYDGMELTCVTITITSSNKLAANHTLSATTLGSITNVGTVENVIATYKIFAAGVDVTSNYSITTKPGLLEVTKADVTGSISIKGNNIVGSTLRVEKNLTPSAVELVYEWYSNTVNSTSGGTKIFDGGTVTLAEDLIGKYIYVIGKINNSNYNDKTFSAITTSDKNYSDVVKSGKAPILMEETSTNVFTNGYIFGNSSISARRNDVTSIVIKNNMEEVSGNTVSWDVSKLKDQSVTAWLVPNGPNYILYIGAEGKIIVSNGYALFAEYSNCTSITGLVNLTTYEVTNMSRMFSNLSKVTSLDVSTLDTASCGDFSYMFNGCSALTSLNVSKFDTIRATNMKMMFNGVSKVNALNVSGFDTVNVRDMSGMFKGCSSVSGLDVSLFDTTNVENMASMFNGCSSLTSLDVTGFITTSAKSMGRMFKDCNKLTRLDLCSFDLSKLDGSTYLESLNGVNDINEVEMFKGCASLKSILFGKHFARINGANMFDGCSALNIIIAQSEAPMSLSTDTGLNSLTNAIIYVPNDSSYTNYLKANNYSSVFGDRRIKRMLEVLGEGKVNLYYGDTYTSAGALVAGCAEDSKNIYESYGYTLEVTGLPVDTTVIGIHKVKFNLKYMNTTVDSM